MLKEVGASGQISLGKKYAGNLFEVEFQLDGSIIMRPVKVVPATQVVSESIPAYGNERVQDARRAASGWAAEHARDIDEYNAWASEREPYSQRVRRWRKSGGT
jgi:hypothetical protein